MLRLCLLAFVFGTAAVPNAEAIFHSYSSYCFGADASTPSGLLTRYALKTASPEILELRRFNSSAAGGRPHRLVRPKAVKVAQAQSNSNASYEQTVEQQVTVLYEDFVSYAHLILNNPNPARLEIPGYKSSLEFIEYSLNKATEAYQAKDYDSVNRIILAALDKVEAVSKKEQATFDLYMQAAEEAYLNEQYEQGQKSIAWALSLRPTDSTAQSLSQLIEALPHLIASRRQAEDARAQGDLSGELKALKQVLAALPQNKNHDAEITQTRKRIQWIERIQRDQIFIQAVARGAKAVKNQNINVARQALVTAQKMRPSAVETKNLHIKVTKLETVLQSEKLLQTAIEAANSDNWTEALSVLEQILKLDSDHGEANQQRNLALKIIAHQKQIEQFAEHPQRLAATNIAAAAKELIESADELKFFSRKLGFAAEDLEEKIQLWESTVTVRVISDGETEIIVLGVGIVGKTKERTIELKAGRHVFEGSRKGYKSVLTEVMISHDGGEIPTVTVICKEKI